MSVRVLFLSDTHLGLDLPSRPRDERRRRGDDLFESFERAAAYLEIPATLGLCLISLWRDPNRRLPHDRVVHTAVLRVPRTSSAPKPRKPPRGKEPAR